MCVSVSLCVQGEDTGGHILCGSQVIVWLQWRNGRRVTDGLVRTNVKFYLKLFNDF